MGGIDVHLPLPQETTPIFSSLPEWIVDDIADFLLFALQCFPLGIYRFIIPNIYRIKYGFESGALIKTPFNI
jgi:hypothetical protein